MVRPSRPAPLMLDEPFMLFSGPCSAAEQGAGMLSPCSADVSPKPPSSTTNASGPSNAAKSGPAAGAGTVIHVHPHTVSGSRVGGSHFNAPSPPRPSHHESLGRRGKGRKLGLSIAEAVADAQQRQEEENQLTQRSDASGDLEACLNLPQRPATARARGGAFNSFFFKLGGSSSSSSSSNGAASSSGGATPANGSSGKKKKRAFPGFTPKGLGGIGFGSLTTPRHSQQPPPPPLQQQAEKPTPGKTLSQSGSSPPTSGMTRGSSFLNLYVIFVCWFCVCLWPWIDGGCPTDRLTDLSTD